MACYVHAVYLDDLFVVLKSVGSFLDLFALVVFEDVHHLGGHDFVVLSLQQPCFKFVASVRSWNQQIGVVR